MNRLLIDIDRNNSLSYFENISKLTKIKNKNVFININSKNPTVDRIAYDLENIEEQNSFIEEICHKIYEIIKKQVIEKCYKYFDENYFYFDENEKDGIFEYIINEVNSDKKFSSEIKKNINNFFQHNSIINIDGFINFRLQFLSIYSQEVVERAIDYYLISKEYSNYIAFLKNFSDFNKNKE